MRGSARPPSWWAAPGQMPSAPPPGLGSAVAPARDGMTKAPTGRGFADLGEGAVLVSATLSSPSGSGSGLRCSPGLGGGPPETRAGPAQGLGGQRAAFPDVRISAPFIRSPVPGSQDHSHQVGRDAAAGLSSSPEGPLGWDVWPEGATRHGLLLPVVPSRCLRIAAGSCPAVPARARARLGETLAAVRWEAQLRTRGSIRVTLLPLPRRGPA